MENEFFHAFTFRGQLELKLHPLVGMATKCFRSQVEIIKLSKRRKYIRFAFDQSFVGIIIILLQRK